MSTMPTSAAIKPGVYFAVVEDRGVLMDVIGDRYFGLTDWSTRIWTWVQRGAAIPEMIDNIAVQDAISKEAATELLREQLEAWQQSGLLLTDAQCISSSDVPIARPPGRPAAMALAPAVFDAGPLSPITLVRWLRASLWATVTLRRRGLGWTVRRIQELPSSSIDVREKEATLARTARAYVATRRLFRQGSLDCLPRSVALMAALRRRGIDAQLCIGARSFPFLAHAWVEVDGVSVNERLDKLQGFEVIARF